MKEDLQAIEFPEVNVRFAEHQEEYSTLPAYLQQDEDGIVVSCWKLNLLQRLVVLVTGKIWHSQITCNYPLQPISLAVIKPLESSNETND